MTEANREDARELIITGSFNGLLFRIAGLDHLGILQDARKILKQAKRQKTEPSMRMSAVIQTTGMTKEDLELFIACGLLAMTENADDPVLSLKDVFCLVKIFSRFLRE